MGALAEAREELTHNVLEPIAHPEWFTSLGTGRTTCLSALAAWLTNTIIACVSGQGWRSPLACCSSAPRAAARPCWPRRWPTRAVRSLPSPQCLARRPQRQTWPQRRPAQRLPHRLTLPSKASDGSSQTAPVGAVCTSESGAVLGGRAQREVKALLQFGVGGLGHCGPQTLLDGIGGGLHVQGVDQPQAEVGSHKKPAVFIQPS